MNEPFRTREPEATTTPEIEVAPTETRNVVSGVEDKSISENFEPQETSELDKWEIQNGKYGLDYLGIKEISKEFPLKMQFPYIDNFIKSEMKERGIDLTPENWQNILAELETEANTDKKNSFERLNKLYNYLKTLKKFREIKAKKEAFKKFIE
jgi:hypothetical protein